MTIQVPVLDDRSFEQLLAEARARVPVHTPEWTNLNASDPGVTLLELFGSLVDNLLYRSNRIPEANRLKFLSLLGIPLAPPSPGLGLIQVTNAKGPLEPLLLEVGTQASAGPVHFATTTGLAVLPVTTQAWIKRPQVPDEATRARYQLLYASFLAADSDQLSYYEPVQLAEPATGKPDPVIDIGDTVSGTIDRSVWLAVLAPANTDLDAVRRAIAGKTFSIGVYPGPSIPGRTIPAQRTGGPAVDPGLIVEIAAPEQDATGQAGLGFGIGPARYTRLQPSYAEPVLVAPGVINVELPRYADLLVWSFDPEEEGTGDYPPRLDAEVGKRLVTWLRLRYPPLADATAFTPPTPLGQEPDDCCCDEGFDTAAEPPPTPGLITWIGGNAARVAQAVRVDRENLGVGTGAPFQQLKLANTPVCADEEHPLLVEVRDVAGAWHPWTEIDDIYAAGATETRYQLNRADGSVLFGNGLAGLRVPRLAAVRASYHYGGTLAGQVPTGAINTSSALPGGFSVANPVPTWGAADGESPADGEAAISRWLRHRDRLVTAEDFTDIARRTPGVDLGRVEVLPLFHPDHGAKAPGVVTVMVIPRSDPLHPTAPVPDRQFLNAVCGWLEPRRLITTELHVCAPVYQRLWVSVGIACLPGRVPTLVQQAVTDAVREFLSPLTGGLPEPGHATGPGWPLGVAVRVQDIEAVATRVPGVRYVDSVILAAEIGHAVVSPLASVPIEGLQLPEATVFTTNGPATDPRSGAQQITNTVPVPVVPAVC